MKYKVLIVDDEPIILSGIKYILNWEDYDAEVVSSARNGKEALEIIRERKIDIVIADIRMPVMDGLELLKTSSAEYPAIVFIMLTSLEEFSLAKKAIEYRAVDYLLKTELDESVLSKSLKHAIEEYERRGASLNSSLESGDQRLRAEEALTKLYITENEKYVSAVENKFSFSSFAFIFISLTFPPDRLDYSFEDKRKLYLFECEVIEKVTGGCFNHACRIMVNDRDYTSALYFCPDVNSLSFERELKAFEARLIKASAMMTPFLIRVTSSSVYKGRNSVRSAISDIKLKENSYYLGKPNLDLENLELNDAYARIENDIRIRSGEGISATIERVSKRISTRDHKKDEALWLLDGLLSASAEALSEFNDRSSVTAVIAPLREASFFLTGRTEILLLLKELEKEINQLLSSSAGEKSKAVEKAKVYIRENIYSRLMLQDVAEAVGLSPGYLSTLFKKVCHMSLIDYINQSKVEKAMEMMDGGQERISDIALSLGFDNIYYFSKVFKKVAGMPPTSYLRQLRKS